MSKRLITTVVFCAAMAATHGALYMDAPKVQARAEVVWTRPICVETNRYIGWPSVCRLKNGDLIAVFSGDRAEHVCPFGKVQMVRSSDAGETWTAPQTIANGPIDDRDAGIVQMPDGEIVVTWFTSIAYLNVINVINGNWPESDRRHWWKRHDEKISSEVRDASLGNWRISSRHNGRTCSKPEKMIGVSQTPHGPILLRDGSLFQIGRSFSDSRQGEGEKGRTIISTWKSLDAGHTWTCLCPELPDMNGENSKPHQFHEPHAVELSDGTLVAQNRRAWIAKVVVGMRCKADFVGDVPCLAAVIRTGHRAARPAMLECPHAENRLAVFRQNRRRMALIDVRRAHGDDCLAEFFLRDIDDWQLIMAWLHDFLRTCAVW